MDGIDRKYTRSLDGGLIIWADRSKKGKERGRTRTGGLLSLKKSLLRTIHSIHQVTPVLVVIAAGLILNYLTAYQAMHRVAKVQAGDSVLIIGASGDVGTARVQLGKEAGLRVHGLASAAKHGVLTENGARPIDYRNQDFVELLRETETTGLDYVFNGMGEEYLERGLAVLRHGGVLV